MAEHGILMRDEMVRALLRKPGDPLRKTVTRRTSDQWAKRKVGDILWVREAFCSADMGPVRRGGPIAYRADYTAERIERDHLGPWQPSIHMPRWASRITLRIVDLRLELGAKPNHGNDWFYWYKSRWSSSVDYIGRHVGLAPSGEDHCPTGWKPTPHPWADLPHVDDAEARREGVEDRAAYLTLWESINGPEYPEKLWRIEFEEITE